MSTNDLDPKVLADLMDAVREEARQEERAAVVAWLRTPCGAHYFADAIERGDHIRRGEVTRG